MIVNVMVVVDVDGFYSFMPRATNVVLSVGFLP